MIDLRLGDCLELMREIPDASIDAVITDPPYGIAKARHRTNTNGKQSATGAAKKGEWYNELNEWDLERPPLVCFDEIRRVSKKQIIFGGNYFADLLPPISSWIEWDKDNTNTKFSHFELAWCSVGGAARKIKWRWNGMLQEPGFPKDKREHPTQKPLGLIEKILSDYTNEGDTILDPFMGSGTTGVACVKLNRSFIGFEINPDYFAIAQRRVADAQKQMTMALA